MSGIKQSILKAKIALDYARSLGDPLRVDLAEAALNDLLDRLDVTQVTRNDKEPHNDPLLRQRQS